MTQKVSSEHNFLSETSHKYTTDNWSNSTDYKYVKKTHKIKTHIMIQPIHSLFHSQNLKGSCQTI